jgi:hypothetical protein
MPPLKHHTMLGDEKPEETKKTVSGSREFSRPVSVAVVDEFCPSATD